jgi:hypothetical protein
VSVQIYTIQRQANDTVHITIQYDVSDFMTSAQLTHLAQSVGLSAAQGALYSALFNLASAVGRVGFGLLADTITGVSVAFLQSRSQTAVSTSVFSQLTNSISRAGRSVSLQLPSARWRYGQKPSINHLSSRTSANHLPIQSWSTTYGTLS